MIGAGIANVAASLLNIGLFLAVGAPWCLFFAGLSAGVAAAIFVTALIEAA